MIKESYYKSKYPIPDQSLATPYNRLIVAILLLIYILNGIYLATQIQEYLKSFHTTRETQVSKFYPLSDVPQWKITFTK